MFSNVQNTLFQKGIIHIIDKTLLSHDNKSIIFRVKNTKI